jgi:predicted porin
MKKTIIASAIAAVVAAPAAFADLSISGAAQVEMLDIDNQTVGNSHDSAFDLNFSASEDLGNGMKAFAAISLMSDYDGDTTVGRNDQKLGLSGDFGTVALGKMETFTEGKVSAMASVDSSENLAIEPGVGGDRVSKGAAYAYSSPTFNGIQFNAACVTDETITAAQGGGSTCDHTDIMVQYTNGPLTIRVGDTEYAHTTTDASAGNLLARDVTAIGVQYAMGDLTLIAVNQDTKRYNGTSEINIDGYMVGAKYKMGNNTIGLGFMNQDTSATADEDQMIIDFTHNLSKNVAVYITHHQDDNGASADVDTTAVGMKMAF